MVQAVEAERARRARWGFLSGATMALGASLSFAAARAGILGGLGVADLIFARFLVAGAIMLPLLVRWGNASGRQQRARAGGGAVVGGFGTCP